MEGNDITRLDVRRELHDYMHEYSLVTAGFPCSTGSWSRWNDAYVGPPPVRSRLQPDGMSGLPPRSFRELVKANAVYDAGAELLLSARQAGCSLVIENPAARHDPFALGGRLWF